MTSNDFTVVEVPAVTWAVFRSNELPNNAYGSEIRGLFQRAYSEWLPTSGYDRFPGPDFEIYSRTDDGKYYEEAWIPVTNAREISSQKNAPIQAGVFCAPKTPYNPKITSALTR